MCHRPKPKSVIIDSSRLPLWKLFYFNQTASAIPGSIQIGGLGLAPGANIGTEAAIFEAVHGSAPDIAGKKIANPCALLLAAAEMLDYLGMGEKGGRVRSAIRAVLETARDQVTPDMGGTGTTDTFADALVAHLHG